MFQGWLSVSSGMAHIHHLGIMHTDLKPQNILTTSPQDEPDDFCFKICDIAGPASGLSGTYNMTSSSRCQKGTVPYQAPEVLKGDPWTKTGDIYSFGMVMRVCSTIVLCKDARGS